MKTFFKELFEYNHYFNEKLSDIFYEKNEKLNEPSIKLFSHVLNAHHIWNSRIKGESSKYGIWQVQGNNLQDINSDNRSQTLFILDTHDLDRSLTYINSKGDAFTNTVRDILFHVINHSTYHRGQIAAQLKQCGIEPLTTDYIFYKR